MSRSDVNIQREMTNAKTDMCGSNEQYLAMMISRVVTRSLSKVWIRIPK